MQNICVYIYIFLSFEYASKFFPSFFVSKLFRASCSVPDLRENLEVRLAPKGRMAAEHDEKHHAQRPNVHLKKSGSLLEKFQSFICHFYFYVIYVCFIHIYMFYVRNHVKIMWKICDIEKTLHLLQYSALSSVFFSLACLLVCSSFCCNHLQCSVHPVLFVYVSRSPIPVPRLHLPSQCMVPSFGSESPWPRR